MPPGIDLRVVGQDQMVPTVDGREVPYANLDNAASTPPLLAVVRKLCAFLPWYASVHRGAGLKSRLATAVFEEARRRVAAFFGYDPETNVVLFGKNTTEALNKLAYRWPWEPGDIVVASLAEHHSNDLPWRRKAALVYLGLREDGAIDLEHLSWCLAAYAPRVKLVALTGASNVTGCLTDIHRAAVLAHRHGARIVVDGAQLAAHRPLSALPDDDPGHLDFLAASGHKMYAPFGQGVLIGPRDFFARGDPEFAGGGTVSGVTLGEVRWAPPPEREEAGTPNTVGAVAMAAAMQVLEEAGLETIAAHERALTARLLERLNGLPGIRLYGPRDPGADRVGIVSFNLEGLPHGLVAAALACEAGIGVRSGCFCARPYVQRLLGLSDGEAAAYLRGDLPEPRRPGMVRVSFGLYNGEEDVDRLVEAIGRIIDRPQYYRTNYVFDREDGYWWPQGWRMDYRKYFSLDVP
ncbi:MAG: aminotransferase class V-fold PLP-dependent enzyme [Bacteroidota bacterium]